MKSLISGIKCVTLALVLAVCGWQMSASAEQAADIGAGEQAAVTAGVNINSATAAALAEMLVGVGEKKAEAIVTYREANGPFGSKEELMNVKGIGTVTLEKNRKKISL